MARTIGQDTCPPQRCQTHRSLSQPSLRDKEVRRSSWLHLLYACPCIPHYRMNHDHISNHLSMSAGKLRPSGGVTGSGVIWAQHQWQGLLEAPYQFPVPFLWFSKESASERPAGWPFTMESRVSRCLVHFQSSEPTNGEKQGHPEMVTYSRRKGSFRRAESPRST